MLPASPHSASLSVGHGFTPSQVRDLLLKLVSMLLSQNTLTVDNKYSSSNSILVFSQFTLAVYISKLPACFL